MVTRPILDSDLISGASPIRVVRVPRIGSFLNVDFIGILFSSWSQLAPPRDLREHGDSDLSIDGVAHHSSQLEGCAEIPRKKNLQVGRQQSEGAGLVLPPVLLFRFIGV